MAEPGCVVISGASTGIGAACALQLDKLGLHVFAGVRRIEDGDALRAQASERLRPLHLDVTKPESLQCAITEVAAKREGKRLIGIVNNAGINVAGPMEFVPVGDLRRQLEVNVVGQVALTQAFLPMLRESKGRVVFIGSTSGFLATPLQGAYCASKFAIEAIADSLRFELKPWGIEVSVVRPGAIKTPIWDKSLKEAEAAAASGPAAMTELYGDLIDEVKAYARESYEKAFSPDIVARDVIHALTAPRPRTRYCEGYTATTQQVLSLLPDRLRDWVLSKSSVM